MEGKYVSPGDYFVPVSEGGLSVRLCRKRWYGWEELKADGWYRVPSLEKEMENKQVLVISLPDEVEKLLTRFTSRG